MRSSEPTPLQRLIHRFRFAVRAFTAFVMTALLLANLATAANAYPDLSSCSRSQRGHTAHADLASVDDVHTSEDNHHSTEAITVSTDDACCGTCDGCNGYFDAHLQGLNLVMACVLPSTPHGVITTQPAHATDFTHRPGLPPPRPASAHPRNSV